MWNLGGAGAEVGGGAPSTKPGDEQKVFCVCAWCFSLESDQEDQTSNLNLENSEIWSPKKIFLACPLNVIWKSLTLEASFPIFTSVLLSFALFPSVPTIYGYH